MKNYCIVFFIFFTSFQLCAQQRSSKSYTTLKDSVQVLANQKCMLVKPSKNPSAEENRYFSILDNLKESPVKHLQALILEDDQFVSLYGFIALCSISATKVKKKHKMIMSNETPMSTCIIGKDNISSGMTIGEFAASIYKSKSRK